MKKERHAKILELINSRNVCRQEELTKLLNDSGIDATQATISRDIKELRLIKVLDKTGKYRYTLPSGRDVKDLEKSKYNSIIKNGVQNIDFALNLVVIKCHTGMAMAVCSAIDAVKNENIVGTLAGDDTIFIAVKSEETAKKIAADLRLML